MIKTNYRNEIRKRTVRTAPQGGKHHGEGPADGAQRNARIAAMNDDRREQSRSDKEDKIAARRAAAEKRKKETLAMATEDTVNEDTHVFHVRLKPMDTRLHRMVDRDASEPMGSKPKGDKLVVKVKAADRREATNKLSRHLAKNFGVHNVASIEHKGLAEETGTEARVKIKNVSRLDDAEPTSEKSKLARTGEIKNKKIDEERSMSINRNFGLSESLIAATRTLLEKKYDGDDVKGVGKGKTAVDTKPETDDQVNDGDDSPKKDKKKLDPVGKEDDDVDNDGDVDNSDKYLKNRRKAIGKAMKEETELEESFVVYHKEKKHMVSKHANLATAKKHAEKKGSDYSTASFEYWSDKINPRKVTNEEVEQVDEVLSKKSPAGEWIKDFQKSDNPKFAGKSPEKRKQMALAAYYAKQRNEEVEEVDEAKLSPEDFMKGARRAGTGTDDQLKASASKKNAGPGSGKIRQLSKDELKRRGVEEEFSAEEIARLEEIEEVLDSDLKKLKYNLKSQRSYRKAEKAGDTRTMYKRFSGQTAVQNKIFKHHGLSTQNVPSYKDYTKEDLDESFAIVHKKTGRTLSTHDDVASARDEHSGLENKDEYSIKKTKSGKKSFSMKEGNSVDLTREEIARLEEIASKFDIQETSYEKGLQDHEPRVVSGVKGAKSKPFTKKFPHQKAMEKWMDSDDYSNHDVHRIERA